MSRRRELSRRLAALTDIADIMSAMKSLALMEIRILGEFMGSQRRMVAGIEASAADFLKWRPQLETIDPGRELCVVLGSEQGFCGDFNEAVVERLEAECLGAISGSRWIVVGQRLASRLDGRAEVALTLPGATVADEVPATLLRLTREIGALSATAALSAYGISALYHCDATGDIRLRRLLPLRDLPPVNDHPYAAELNLSPPEFLAGLTRHYLYAALNEVLYSGLLAENRQRQAHMDGALQKLDEKTERLRLAYNAQRQEEITEEIEILLLSGDALS